MEDVLMLDEMATGETLVTVPDEIEDEVIDEPEDVFTVTLTGIVFNCPKLNVREEPSTAADIVCVIDNLATVLIDEEESTEDFYKVCTENGAEGFCMKKFIKLV